jgi:hypothetical protein
MSNGDSRRRLRLNLTVTTPMAFALEDLAERSGLPVTTQATMMLRQALERTMQTERVQERVRRHNAGRNLQTSQLERTTEHAVEKTYAEQAHAWQATPEDTSRAEATV